MMLGFLLARAGVEVRRAGKARRLPARLPRRHHPPFDARGDARARVARRISRAAASEGARDRAATWAIACSRSPTSPICRPAASSSRSCRNGIFWTSSPRRRDAIPTFRLLMECGGRRSFGSENGRVIGVRASTPGRANRTVRADLVIGADGRQSIVRDEAGPRGERSRRADGRAVVPLAEAARRSRQILGRFARGRMMVDDRSRRLLAVRLRHPQRRVRRDRGSAASMRSAPTSPRRRPFSPIASTRSTDWDEVKLLTVKVDRLRKWYRPGLLCIGDAAHAMSPMGGVGINLAIQDAVAAANLLADPLSRGQIAASDLARVQRRRAFPARATQAVQVFAQNRLIARVLDADNLAPVAGAPRDPMAGVSTPGRPRRRPGRSPRARDDPRCGPCYRG